MPRQSDRRTNPGRAVRRRSSQGIRCTRSWGGAALEALESRTLLTGLTIITHGYSPEPDASLPIWVNQMGDDITMAAGGFSKVARYTMRVHNGIGGGPILVDDPVLDAGSPRLSHASSGEGVLKLDWTDLNGGIHSGSSTSTALVADAVVDVLLNDHLDGVDPLSLPLHLIGHSRGGSLIAALARRLGERGAWVDHVTLLDPHPVDGVNEPPVASVSGEPVYPDFNDAPLALWSNVVFADNYWRSDFNDLFLADPAAAASRDFDGEPVPETANQLLSESVLSSGGHPQEHNDVRVWYAGTIGPRQSPYAGWPTTDGEVSISDSWYGGTHPERGSSGYAYALVIGGVRPLAGLLTAFGGSATRPAPPVVGLQRPMLGSLSRTESGSSIPLGQTLVVSYKCQDRDSPSDVLLYLDSDANPFNGNFAAGDPAYMGADFDLVDRGYTNLGSTGGVVLTLHGAELHTGGNLVPGQNYYIAAKIQDGTHARWAYLATPVTFTAPSSDTTPPMASLSYPAPDKTAAQAQVNAAPKYLDVAFSDNVALDAASVLDSGQEFTLSGPGVGNVVVDGTPVTVNGKYRYSFTGDFGLGQVTVAFTAGTFKDAAGNWNTDASQSFTVVVKPVINSVTPNTLVPKADLDDRQWIYISGTGFGSHPTLTFRNDSGNVYSGRVPTFILGDLAYYISVGPTQQGWTVSVTSNGVESEPFPFVVTNAVATPTISPAGGQSSTPVEVTLATATSGATIRYTTDGTNPTQISSLYSGPFTLSTSAVVKARAFKINMPDSAVASATYSISTAVAPAVASVNPASLQPLSSGAQTLTVYGSGFNTSSSLEFLDPSGTSRVTGSTSFISDTQLSYPLVVNAGSGTWKLRVVNGGGLASNYFTFQVVDPPNTNAPVLVSPADGATGLAGSVTLSWQGVPGATVYRIMVATDPLNLPRNPSVEVATGIVWNTTSNTAQTAIPARPAGVTEYWQVKAMLNGVWNAWSPIFCYTAAGEFNVPPVVTSFTISPSPVLQGEPMTFVAAGVYDRNLNNTVKWVEFDRESNGTPGLQRDGPNTDDQIGIDSDGSDGWSAVGSSFGLAAGNHTIYATAIDTFYLRSTSPVIETMTVQSANLPAPRVLGVSYIPATASTRLVVRFNVDVSPTITRGSFLLHYWVTVPDSMTYDQATNTATLLWNAAIPSGNHWLALTSPTLTTNAAGVSLQGDIQFQFFVRPGDADQNGRIDIDDYFAIDLGYSKRLTGWGNGDFNADGVIDGDDYFLIDQGFLGQGSVLATATPVPVGAPVPRLFAAEAQIGDDTDEEWLTDPLPVF